MQSNFTRAAKQGTLRLLNKIGNAFALIVCQHDIKKGNQTCCLNDEIPFMN